MMKAFYFVNFFLFHYEAEALSTFNEYKFQEVVDKMEQDVLEFAREIERLYSFRCMVETLDSCRRNNYDDCLSEYEEQVCPADKLYSVPSCLSSDSCSSLFDFTASNVKFPGANRNPVDANIIEGICFSRKMDEWLVEKRERDKEFWKSIGTEPRGFFFGSPTGTLRIFPARQSKYCGTYDARLRPWYLTGSSGPKNIVLILDTSGSMYGPKLEYMKLGAERVIQTLTVGDRIAIVSFNTEASVIGNLDVLLPATNENKKFFLRQLDRLESTGATNFFDAFKLAFDIINASVKVEAHVSCNSAILFLTDGEMTHPTNISDEDVVTLVASNINSLQKSINHDVFLFSYSVSLERNVHELPSRLACATKNGVWSKITDEKSIEESLSSYYKLFALGLGTDINKDFTAWVEPYHYATGNVLGTTVSAPVYDNTKKPPLFLGVVGIDYILDAFEAALTAGKDRKGNLTNLIHESIRRIAVLSTAKCPRFNLTQCQIESYRRSGTSGSEALCSRSCNEEQFVETEASICPIVSDLPKDLWRNKVNEGKSYEERVCCSVGQTLASSMCLPDVRLSSLSPTSNPISSNSSNLLDLTASANEVAGTLDEEIDFENNSRRRGVKTSNGSSVAAGIFASISVICAAAGAVYMFNRIKAQMFNDNGHNPPPPQNPIFDPVSSPSSSTNYQSGMESELETSVIAPPLTNDSIVPSCPSPIRERSSFPVEIGMSEFCKRFSFSQIMR